MLLHEPKLCLLLRPFSNEIVPDPLYNIIEMKNCMTSDHGDAYDRINQGTMWSFDQASFIINKIEAV